MDLDSNPLPTLGDDLTSQSGIDFEADPRSLRMILENRELSPSVLKFRSSLTPATHTNKMNKVSCGSGSGGGGLAVDYSWVPRNKFTTK